MTQKTISLPEDVYIRLKQLKADDETFGQLISRLMKTQEDIPDEVPLDAFAGAFGDEDSEEWGEIEKKLYATRMRPSDRDIKLD